MQLSTRYTPHLAIVMLLAAVPVVLHSYARVENDECAAPARLVRRSIVRPPSTERIAFVEATFGTSQFREGRLPAEDGLPAMSWVVVRTHDAKNLYYRVAHRVLGREPDRVRVESVQVGNVALPIRQVEYTPELGSPLDTRASYLLVYDGKPVANPYLNQLLAAPLRVFTGSRPMTVFFISGRTTRDQVAALQEQQTRWLTDSWHEYRAICFP